MATEIRNRNCVVALTDSDQVKARAVRVSHRHDWEVHTYPGRQLVAVVKTGIPENVQRHLVLAIIKELD